MGVRPSTVEEACVGVDARVNAIFARVEAVRAEVLGLVGAALRRGSASVDCLAGLEPTLRSALGDQDDPRLAGLGYIAAVGVFADEPRWLEWVRRSEDGALNRLQPDLDPGSFAYYDFTAADWFRHPLATGTRSVVGPYVDFAGTDEYVVTLTVPVELDGRTLGVAGADLRPGELADSLLPGLCALGTDLALVNDDGRVVVSTSPRLQVGALVRRSALEDRPCGVAPWSLLAFDPSQG